MALDDRVKSVIHEGLGGLAQSLQLVAIHPTISMETCQLIRKHLTPRLKKGKKGQYSTQDALNLLNGIAWANSVDKANFAELLEKQCFEFEI